MSHQWTRTWASSLHFILSQPVSLRFILILSLFLFGFPSGNFPQSILTKFPYYSLNLKCLLLNIDYMKRHFICCMDTSCVLILTMQERCFGGCVVIWLLCCMQSLPLLLWFSNGDDSVWYCSLLYLCILSAAQVSLYIGYGYI